MKRGKYIVIEGHDDTGKSIQVGIVEINSKLLILNRLSFMNLPVVQWSQPIKQSQK